MLLKNPEKLPGENNQEFVYRVLKDNIMSLYLKPGEKIMEGDISEILNVSRTPIRETLIILQNEKLVEIKPKKGTYITLIDLKLVEAGVFLRNISEKEILRLACTSFPEDSLKELKEVYRLQENLLSLGVEESAFYPLDRKFHETIFKGCDKESVWETIEGMIHFNRLRTLRRTGSIDMKAVAAEHLEIIHMIEEHDTAKIDEMTGKHFSNFKRELSILSKKYSDYFL